MPSPSPSSQAISLPPDRNRGSELVAAQWVTTSIATILVVLRLFTRRVLLKKSKWKDYVIIDYTISLALASSLAQATIAIFQVREGFGRNIQYLHPSQAVTVAHYLTATVFLYLVGTYLMRIAVCLFILQLLPFTEKRYRRTTYGIMAFFTLVTLAASLVFGLQCIPLRAAWDSTVPGRRLSRDALKKIGQFQGVLSVIMDVLCVVLPLPVIRKVQVAWRQKLALMFVLGLGLSTAVLAALRFSLFKAASDNPTWDLVPNAILACLEENIGIIAGCIPSLQQFNNAIKRRRRDKRTNSVQHLCEEGTNRRKPSMKPIPDSLLASPTTVSSPFNPSPTSTAFSTEVVEMKYDSEGVKNWTPQMADAPRFDRPSLTPEQAQGIQEYHMGKTQERKASVVDERKASYVDDRMRGRLKSWSPRMVDAPRFERQSLTPDQAEAIKEYHMGKVEERRASCVDVSQSKSPKSWSPRMVDAPRFERQSLTPDQAQAIKEYHMGKNKERRASCVAKPQSKPIKALSARVDQPQPILEDQLGKAEEGKDSWVDGRLGGLSEMERLKMRPELGYSCTIEAGPSSVAE